MMQASTDPAKGAAGDQLAVQKPESDRAGTLWAGDLPYFADENYLHRIFVNTGSLVSVKVMRNKNTQVSLGYGFLEFSSHEAASEVLETFNGTPMPGTHSSFRLNWAAFGVGKPIAGLDWSLFVGDLAPDVSDYVLQEAFRQHYPTVRSAKVITDPLTGRTKGFGFVRFAEEKDRNEAIDTMGGTLVNDRAIRVSAATPRKAPNTQLQHTHADKIPHPSDFDPNNTTIFIGGLSGGVDEHMLRELFGQFGDIIYTKVPANKGCGFCQFVERQAAERAMQRLQGHVLGDNPMRLSWGRSAVASRPALSRPFSMEQFSSPYGLVGQTLAGYPMYSLAQASGAPSSQLYGGVPQAYQQQLSASMTGNAFGFSNAPPVHQANMMDQLTAQFAQLSPGNRGIRNVPRSPYGQPRE